MPHDWIKSSLGYILGSLAMKASSAPGQMQDRSH
jgi:hypothetical protein